MTARSAPGGRLRDHIFRLEGEYWTLAYDGTVIRLRDAKGMRYLAQLLGHPGERLEAIRLALAVDGRAASGDASSADAERARLAVTKRIKAVVRKIAANHPSLGYHLGTTIRTGRFCAYAPDPRNLVAWQL